MHYDALIPAAGVGRRFGGATPKQYWLLEDKPLLLHSLERLADGLPLRQIYVAIAPEDGWFDAAIGVRPGVTVLRCGGATRGETVRNALRELAHAGDDDWLAVHDAVRPCIDRASLQRLQQELAQDDTGGLLAMPVVGTVKRADSDGRRVARTEDRDGLWIAQTPQMFRYRVLRAALAGPDAARYTDEAQAVEALGRTPRLVTGSPNNVKITYGEDLALAAAIMSAQRLAR